MDADGRALGGPADDFEAAARSVKRIDMAAGDSLSGQDGRSILDATAFEQRLEEEIARVRRSGGFLSLAMFEVVPRDTVNKPEAGVVARIGDRLRRAVRLEDILAERGRRVALLMPDTSG